MNREEILKEQYFPSKGLSIDERDFLLDLLSYCKDISDSKYCDKVGRVVQLSMDKEKDNLVHISGAVAYKNENRMIDGDVIYYKDSIVFDTKMTRLCYDGIDKEYMVLDIFKPTSDGYELVSRYNNDSIEYKKKIDMKGKIR